MISLRFACGHARVTVDAKAVSVNCPACGDSRVQSVQAPAPRFSGMVQGPCARFEALAPARIVVATEALRLKEQDDA